TQIQALISGAVADTNAAFGRSGISTSIILVHTAEVSYAETGDADIDGPRLVDPNDGYLDDVHALRDEYGADCVSLWVDQLNSGGIGYFPHPSLTGVGASGFSMLRLSNATTLTLAHELGHNLFCAHDRSDAPDAPWADYSYGYVETGGNWQTIMAVTGATYIPYFANPNVSWPGPVPPPPGPTGVAEGSPNPSDIARTINETSYYVANFRPRRILGLPSVLHVDSTAMPGGDGASWATAMSDLGDAVCAAAGSNGAVTQIWVRAGTYTPDRESGDRALSFHLVDGVEILGGFAGGETAADQRDPQLNTTILSGEIGAAGLTDNSYHVVDGAARAASAVLDGFTIRDGYADADPNDGGAGVRVFGVGAPTIRDCRIVDNAGNRGGGVYCAFGASPRFENCRIQLNSALLTTWPAGGGGAHCYVNAHPTFSACEFSANTAELGAGVAMLFGCAPEFADCEFLQNDGGVDGSGGGLYAYGDCDATLTRCVFQNNNAHYGMGIALFFDCDPTVTDCDFVDHNRPTDAEGGGMYVYSTCSPVIEGCLFADNHTLSGGGIVCLFGGAPRLAGCVFRGNVADGDSGAASFYSETQPLVVSCLFSGNSAPFGGAISTWFDTTARITNCSLVSNVATNSGAGIYGYEADPLIENSILWGNHVGVAVDEAAQVSGFNTTPIVNASTVQGWSGALGGVANSGADPVLRDADGVDNIAGTPDDDARLSVGSPAIDTGDDALVPVGAVVDLLGRPRTLGAHVDRGAFEFGVSVGDLDQDGRFGAAELGALAVCMGGPDRSPVAAPPYSLAECLAAFDLDSDGDIDARDVAGLQRLP
ncbi:MAG: right-handed parallel beta-helix repeat-containing protein, partial [Phycisphaerales bacterium]|nr:right-handed parallel beta-helix repeat-containing protein [Phycisphaerales bacterium]